MISQRMRVCAAIGLLGCAAGMLFAQEEAPPAPAMMTEASVLFTAEGGEQSVQLVPGQVLEVRLRGNPTTGYSWTLEGYEAQEILVRDEEVSYQSDAPDRMGAPGLFRYRFTAARSGSATLRFLYRRPWEEAVEPLYTAVLNVTVP
ncbi:MAG: protease inhibitor I42 family protein [Verrucomicrobia bacterium]|nr:protease inhibitor I42 family protein [Verrucomicrobiota bacterium]